MKTIKYLVHNLIGVFCFLVVFSFGLSAKYNPYQIKVQHWGPEDGLIHREVRAIFQDHQGIIWIATSFGLSRFDGHSFKNYNTLTHHLQGNRIHYLCEDASGKIWITNDLKKSDIDILDPETGQVSSFKRLYANKINFNFENIISIVNNKDGDVMMGTTNPAYAIIIKKDGRVLQQLLPNMLWSAPLFSTSKQLHYFKCSRRWDHITDLNADEIAVLDSTGKIHEVYPFNENDTRRELNIQYIDITYFFKNGLIYTNSGPDGGWTHKRYGVLENEHWKFSDHPFWDSTLNNDRYIYTQNTVNNVIIGIVQTRESNDFPLFLDPETHEPIALQTNLQYRKDNPLHCTLIDKDGGLWTGTDYGIYRYQLTKKWFNNYAAQNNDSIKKGTINVNKILSIRGLCKQEDYIYFNIEKAGLARIKENETHWDFVFKPTNKYEVNKNDAPWSYGMYKDTLNTIWSSNCYTIYQKKSGSTLFTLANCNGSTIAWCFYRSPFTKTIYIGAEHGIKYMEEGTDSFIAYNHYNEFSLLKQEKILYIHSAQSGQLVLCTNLGLYFMDEKKGIVRCLNDKMPAPNYLPGKIFSHFYQENDSLFWFATKGDGLIKYNIKTGHYKQFNVANGLSNNVLYAVYPDPYGYLWLSSDNGIMRFDKKTEDVTIYLENDGLPSLEFNTAAHYQDEKGKIYFGSLNGFTVFDPKDFYEKYVNDKDILINNYSYYSNSTKEIVDKTRELIRTKEIVLQHGDLFAELEFVMYDYDDPSNVSYKWRIEGLDNKWHFQKENSIKLAALPYGNYTLQIMARNAMGIWSTKTLKIKLSIKPPFYLTFWFIGLSMISFSFIFYIGFKRRLRMLQEKEKINNLLEMGQMKDKFFTHISHELRTPLTLIVNPLKRILADIKDKPLPGNDKILLETANENAGRLLKMVNELLDLSKLDFGKLDVQKEEVQLNNFIKKCFTVFEGVAQLKQMHYQFKTDIQDAVCVLLDKNKLEKIINNLLSNAFKFTPTQGYIRLDCSLTNNLLSIKVQDSGKGISPKDVPHIFERFFQSDASAGTNEGGTGIGLAYCREMTTQMGGSITFETELGKGTCFTVTLPANSINKHNTEISSETTLNSDTGLYAIHTPKFDAPSYDPNKFTLLIAEDNVTLQEYLANLLKVDYNIIVANNGREALDILSNNKDINLSKCLIISDIMMPVMNGIDFLQQIKASEQFSKIPFIILTAGINKELKLSALRIGVDDYLIKPFDDDELLIRVEQLLARGMNKHYYHTEEVEGTDTPSSTEEVDSRIEKRDLSAAQQNWLANLEKVVIDNLNNHLLSVEWLADEMALSRRQLLRKITDATGLTAQEYINEVRLSTAKTLLEEGSVASVKEVAQKVNFNNISYFSTQFKNRYGKSPSEYL